MRAQAALRLAKRKYRCGTTPKDDDDDHEDHDDHDHDDDEDDDDSRVSHMCVHRNVVGNRRDVHLRSRRGLGLMALAGLLWPPRYRTMRHVIETLVRFLSGRGQFAVAVYAVRVP